MAVSTLPTTSAFGGPLPCLSIHAESPLALLQALGGFAQEAQGAEFGCVFHMVGLVGSWHSEWSFLPGAAQPGPGSSSKLRPRRADLCLVRSYGADHCVR